MEQARRTVSDAAQREAAEYRQGEDRPLSSYAGVLAAFGTLVGATAGIAAGTGRRIPSLTPYDVLLLSLGTHKLSRTLSKDAVTSPLRAPFAQYAGQGGPAEVMEEPRKSSSLRHSLGELLSCPFCLDVWVATGFTIGMVFAPRLTRLVASTLSALTGADFLQLAYARAQQAQ